MERDLTFCVQWATANPSGRKFGTVATNLYPRRSCMPTSDNIIALITRQMAEGFHPTSIPQCYRDFAPHLFVGARPPNTYGPGQQELLQQGNNNQANTNNTNSFVVPTPSVLPKNNAHTSGPNAIPVAQNSCNAVAVLGEMNTFDDARTGQQAWVHYGTGIQNNVASFMPARGRG